MFAISTKQALDLWAELEDCYNKRNGFGTDTAEIYAYTLMPSSPTFERLGVDALNSPYAESARELMIDAARALVDIVTEFCERRKCQAKIDGLVLPDWLHESTLARGYFGHRCTVQIIVP